MNRTEQSSNFQSTRKEAVKQIPRHTGPVTPAFLKTFAGCMHMSNQEAEETCKTIIAFAEIIVECIAAKQV